MTALSKPDKYLMKRGDTWYYQRFIPSRFSHVDGRKRIRHSLNTTSEEIAKVRRDAQVLADDNYWRALALEAAENDGISEATRGVEEKLYKAASARAQVYGYVYKTVERLAEEHDTENILERLKVLKSKSSKDELPEEAVIDALLGGVDKPSLPSITVSEVLELYFTKMTFDDQFNKDKDQKYSWEKVKRTSVKYFTEQMGDLKIEEITREVALRYRDWWIRRMLPDENGVVRAKPNTANRHVGNMRTLIEAYYKHIGEETRDNPFRNFYFSATNRSSVKPFENEWVRSKILLPRMFEGIRDELKVIVFALIETGARLSEIVNLMPEDIHLGVNVPYISIRPRLHRELKTPDSERDIPLVGVALVAMQASPEGFERYRGKSNLVSANLMKAFRKRKLLPTKDHVINSFRHAFEKRMQEAEIDYGLRCTLMGHKNTRPSYGDGGSMEFRRDQLLKIAHPFSAELF